MKTAEKIKNFRLRRHLTQNELAKKVELSEISIRKYEAGDRIPKKEPLKKLAIALEVNVNALFNDEMFQTKYKTVDDIMSLLFTLDAVVGLSFDGERKSDGQLIPETISIKLNNDRVNEAISDWEAVRKPRISENTHHFF